MERPVTAILGISAFYHDSAAALIVDGEIVAFNDALESEPQQINSDPYSAWIFKMKTAASIDGLLDAAAYEKTAADSH